MRTMLKDLITENSFDGAPGGTAGSLNFQPSLGTNSSPNVTSDLPNGYFDPHVTGQPDTKRMESSGSYDQSIEQLFKATEKPTPDDLLAGIQYEIGRMIVKDKALAKQKVIDNMKKHGPKYYTKLGMLNIDDDDMTSTVAENYHSEPMKERIKVLDDMVKAKSDKRMKMDQSILDILNVKKEAKANKFVDMLRRPI